MAVETPLAAGSALEWADEASETASRWYHAGSADEARQLCIAILERVPQHGRSLYLLSLIALNSGDPALALDLVNECLRHIPHVPFVHVLKGQILARADHPDEAAACFQQALQLKPGEPVALSELARIHLAQQDPQAAIGLLERSLSLRPNQVDALVSLGAAYREMRRAAEAIGVYRQALHLSPGDPSIAQNLALAQGENGDHAQCARLLEQLISEQPDHTLARYHLARTYLELTQFDKALLQLRNPDGSYREVPNAAGLRATVLFQLGLHQEALVWLRQDPDQLLFSHYDPGATPRQLFEKHRQWGRTHAPFRYPKPAPPQQGGRIRVGYVSGDFRRHSVGWFIRPVLAGHDAGEFEIYCYSTTPREDDLSAELKRHAIWRDAFLMNDQELEECIRRDGIEILVDLSGHTAGNRLGVFARRPAPIQITWLGYPNTTGLEAMEYRFTDLWADPEGEAESLHTEKLLRLPGGFLCYGPDEQSPQPVSPTGPVTFGSFNALPKIHDGLLSVWARILEQVPQAQLLIKASALGCPASQDHLRARFAAAGVDPGRILMNGHDQQHAQHLTAFQEVDIALDTFPYNGATTTCDALWMGVPVVALAGKAHAGRVGVSILQQAGHPEWLAATPEEYVEIAVRLAARPRPPRRERLLPAAMTDGPAFARKLEVVYRQLRTEGGRA